MGACQNGRYRQTTAGATRRLPRRAAAKQDNAAMFAETNDNTSDETPREETMANRLVTSISRRKLLAGSTAATTILLAAPAIVRAQANALKIGVLLPRSGYMASTGQASHRGAMI